MGGFTKIVLKDKSIENIRKHNELLAKAKVRKEIRFYSEDDVKLEYEAFLKGEGAFPEHSFPKDKIKSYKDFTNYWSTEALGEVFVPKFGSLTFDCYFGRTSNNAMKCLKNYIIDTLLLREYSMDSPFEYADGSWTTFLERCSASKLNLELINEKIIEK